jgi:lysophospholipase L1-like esterase
MEFINCIGDSLTFGARDELYRSYPAELSTFFWEKEKKAVFCVNNGISGETSGELRKRIFFTCKSCLEAKIGLLLIGTNDTTLHTQPHIYEDNIRQILLVMKFFYSTVGVGLIPPIYGPGLSIYSLNAQDQVDDFNDVLLKINSFYDFYADFRDMHSYIIDTVHFGNLGYKKMAEIWYNSFKTNGIEL